MYDCVEVIINGEIIEITNLFKSIQSNIYSLSQRLDELDKRIGELEQRKGE